MKTKTWLWRKKNSVKTVIQDKALNTESSLNDVNGQRSSRIVLDAKDDFIHKQEMLAKEAIQDWEEGKAHVASFKKKLDNALIRNSLAEEKITSIDATLKECVKQLHSLMGEHQLTVNDAAVKMSQERERIQALEEKLADANKKLNLLSAEKSNLCGILHIKQNIIEDLSVSKSQLEADFAVIVERLDSSERSNESLKHEISMLQKELMVRNQERAFNLRSYEAAQKQHIVNVEKIDKLESECRRLRIMIRKQLPGPAATTKRRNEGEMLCRSVIEARRKSIPTMVPCLPRDSLPVVRHVELCKPDDRLHAVEEENKILKERLANKISELQSSRIMFARTASKLSQSDKNVNELSKGQACFAKSSSMKCELAASGSENGGNEDNISCAESWASALMSQLERFRNVKPADPLVVTGPSELSLMKDYAEKEKLSTFCKVKSPKSLSLIREVIESMDKEPIPSDDYSNFGELKLGELKLGDQLSFRQFEMEPDWLQDIVKVILQKHQATKLSLDVILHEVRIAFCELDKAVKGKPLDQVLGEPSGTRNRLRNKTKNQLQLNLEEVLHRIIELIDGVIRRVILDYDRQGPLWLSCQAAQPRHKPALPGGQIASVFLWESSELTLVLHRFITVCNNVLGGTAEVEKFVCELATTLEWMLDHCFSLQGVSMMEESIRQQYSSEFSCCVGDAVLHVNDFHGSRHITSAPDRLGKSSTSTTPEGLHILSEMDGAGTKVTDENTKLMDEIANVESAKDMEEKLKSASTKNYSLSTPLKESEKCISNLRSELTSLKDSRGLIEKQFKFQKPISQCLKTQLTEAKVEPNETDQKLYVLETGLEENRSCCKELKATCLDLQFQIESVSGKEKPKNEMVTEEKELRTEWEISAASEKLAECQETILKLGKQLKALASPRGAALVDKRLFDQLLAIDHAKFEDLRSNHAKETICSEPQIPQPASALEKKDPCFQNEQKSSVHFVSNTQPNSNRPSLQKECLDSYNEKTEPHQQNWGTEAGTLVAVPRKKKGGTGLLRKFLQGTKGSNKKLVLP